MTAREIRPKIHSVGALDADRRLFDELIPLPDGTTYNAYLIQGSEKTALLDTVDPTKESVLLENLNALGVRRIDYVISHHAEQNHSGVMPKILEIHPEAKVVTNQKCKEMLGDLLPIPENKFIVVKDGETLSLGAKTLEFIFTPWVHWPETMSTYLKEEKILFSCDFFGSHLASSDLYATDEPLVYRSAKRYYAEIMMPFRTSIKKNLEKIKDLDIKMIAPSHGPVYPKPSFILDAYKDWISDEVKNEVLIPYVSMHGSIRKMAEYLTDALVKRGIMVKPFDLVKTDIGELAMAMVDASTIVIGSPAVLAGPHPLAFYAAYLTNSLRPKTKFASMIGSFGWGSKMPDELTGMLKNLKVEFLEPVFAKGHPKEADFAALERLADDILKRHS